MLGQALCKICSSMLDCIARQVLVLVWGQLLPQKLQQVHSEARALSGMGCHHQYKQMQVLLLLG
jgi:hypothetical protein